MPPSKTLLKQGWGKRRGRGYQGVGGGGTGERPAVPPGVVAASRDEDVAGANGGVEEDGGGEGASDWPVQDGCQSSWRSDQLQLLRANQWASWPDAPRSTEMHGAQRVSVNAPRNDSSDGEAGGLPSGRDGQRVSRPTMRIPIAVGGAVKLWGWCSAHGVECRGPLAVRPVRDGLSLVPGALNELCVPTLCGGHARGRPLDDPMLVMCCMHPGSCAAIAHVLVSHRTATVCIVTGSTRGACATIGSTGCL